MWEMRKVGWGLPPGGWRENSDASPGSGGPVDGQRPAATGGAFHENASRKPVVGVTKCGRRERHT